MARIIVESGPLRGNKYALPEGRTVLEIGRDPRCAIPLSDPMVSRRHLALRFSRGEWIVEDRASRNGTYVNAEAVREKVLLSGDSIRAGDTLFTYLETDDDPLLGQVLGSCRIEKRLGRGGSGTVYRALQLSLERTVALKVLSVSLALDDDLTRAFLAEARAAGRLNHPNVVQVYDAGQEGHRHYIIMEYLEGGTLDELLVARGRILPERAVAVGIDAARAIAFAEEHGIVHRDIKPANLLFSSDGTTKIGDLGIATDLRSRARTEDDSRRTAGSPRYMAPEQAMGVEVDHRADIYALGATLYRSLAGAPPFDGASVREILRKKIEESPPPLGSLAGDVSAALARVVHKMLARRPDDRYPTAAGVLEALEAIQRREGKGRARFRGRGTSPPPGRAAMMSRVAGWLGLFVLLAVSVIIFALMRGREGSEAEGGSRLRTEATRGTGENLVGSPRKGDRETGSGVDHAVARPEASRREEWVARALREVDQLAADYRGGRIAAGEAEKVLAGLRRTLPDEEVVTKRIEGVVELVARDRERAREERLRSRETELDLLLGEEEYAKAASLLSRWEADPVPGSAEWSSARRAELDSALDARIASDREKVAAELARGAFPAAGQVVDALESVLPESRSEIVETLRREVASAREAGAKLRREQARVTLAALALAARFDFSAALERAGPPGESDEKLLLSLEPLRSDLELMRACRDRVHAALTRVEDGASDPGASDRGGESPIIEIALPHSGAPGPGAPESYRVVEVDEDVMLLRSVRTREDRWSNWLDLDEAVLRPAVSAAAEGPGFSRGLALLRLLGRGPRNGGGSDDGPSLAKLLPGGDPEEDRQLEPAIRSLWITAAARRASARVARWSGAASEGGGAGAGRWEFLCREIEPALKAAAKRPERIEDREVLAAAFREARTRALRARPRERFFHAASVQLSARDLLTLVYDFAEPSQIDDFNRRGGPSTKLSIVRRTGRLSLKGEARLLSGEPFREKLIVIAKVPADGYTAKNPNLAFALWTGEGGSVRPDPRRSAAPEAGPAPASDAPFDYFVFAHGYILGPEWDRSRHRWGVPEGVRVTDVYRYLRVPCFLLLGEHYGRAIHQLPRDELLWHIPSGMRLGGEVRVALVFESGKVRWTLNEKPLPLGRVPRLSGLKSREPRRGSVTIFTGSEPVSLSRLEVRGQLDPEWFDRQARARAERELAALLPAAAAPAAVAPPAAAAGGSSRSSGKERAAGESPGGAKPESKKSSSSTAGGSGTP